jgi:hypothetical protein
VKHFVAKVGRFFGSWGFLKLVLWTLTLVILFYAEEDWRGAREWTATKAKWEERGVSFDFAQLVPAPVPDGQNLAALSLFKMEPDPDPANGGYWVPLTLRRAFQNNTDANPLPSLGDWQHGNAPDLVKVGQAIQAEYVATFPGHPLPPGPSEQFATLYPFIAQLREASSSRKFCRFEQNYRFVDRANDLNLVTAQIAVSKLLTCDAILAARARKTDQALDDIKLNNKLAGGLRDQPILVSGLVAIGMTAINLAAVYDGLERHSWSDAQLVELEHDLGRIDFLIDYQRLMRGEPIGMLIPAIDQLKATRLQETFDPKTGAPMKESISPLWADGWLDIWKAQSVDRDLTASDWIDAKSRQVLPRVMDGDLLAQARRLDSWSIYLPWNWLFRVSGDSAVSKALSKFAQAQVWVDEARIACALERYRLAQGKYPATLDMLASALREDLPHDVMSGEAYRYKLNVDPSYLLYSVGWNQSDDGGREVKEKEGRQRDYAQGDWVWPTPR